MPTEFVDRDDECAELLALAANLAHGRGGAMVLEGGSGVGKSALIEEFLQRIAGGPVNSVQVRCSPGIGPTTPYGPIIEVFGRLLERRTFGDKVKRTFNMNAWRAAKTVPQALGELVPALKAPTEAALMVTQAAVRTASVPLDSIAPLQYTCALHIAEELLNQAKEKGPLVVVLDDVQYLDEDSLRVLNILVGRLADRPLGLILSRLPTPVQPGGTPDLLRLWEGQSLLGRVVLGDLPRWAAVDLVRWWHPDAPPELADNLFERTAGQPLFLVHCLRSWV